MASAAPLALSTLAALVTQSASMTGETDSFAEPTMIGTVATRTGFGHAVVGRLATTAVAIVVLAGRPRRWTLGVSATLGAFGSVTFAWGGHGAANEGFVGVIPLGADIVHMLAGLIERVGRGACVLSSKGQ